MRSHILFLSKYKKKGAASTYSNCTRKVTTTIYEYHHKSRPGIRNKPSALTTPLHPFDSRVCAKKSDWTNNSFLHFFLLSRLLSQEIVAQDTERLQYANGVKVVPKSITKTSEELWVLTNRFLRFQLGELDFSEVNFRILKSPVKDLVEGTRCELPAQLKAALRRTKISLYKYPKWFALGSKRDRFV